MASIILKGPLKMKKLIYFIFFLCTFFLLSSNAYAKETVYAASSDGFITLRLAPDEEAPEITVIPACAKLQLISTQNTWGKVIFENKCGWINLSFTAESYKNAANSTGVAQSFNASVKNIRKRVVLYSLPTVNPALGSEEKFVVPAGMILNITRKTKNGWSLVDMNGTLAWVQTEFTEPYKEPENDSAEKFGISYVYALSPGGTGINLTEAPGFGKVLSVIPDCVKLTVRETKGDFAYVSHNGLNGWINLRHTTDSMEKAINNAGKEIKKEYVVSADGEISLMNLPSEFVYDGSFPEASVKEGETVFVLRQTDSGWSYISHKSIKGWAAPNTLTPAEKTENEKIQLCTPYDVYVSSEEGTGIKLYPDAGKSEKGFVTVAECVRMKVITEKDGFGYAINDFASGWLDLSEVAPSYEESLNLSEAKALPNTFYIIKQETHLYSLPTYSQLCESLPLSVISPGTEITVFTEVTTGKRKWGLAEINGQTGWVCLDKAGKLSLPIKKTVALIILMPALILVLIWIIRKKRRIITTNKEA